ncbi:MAG TPA: isocitrate/isopropylmalate family dehydrogenase [Gemmatimonadota bacterium]|nr:isocitrate/isopropylmalate family dehydrogenase [Gemmatimonadota bacterium]
MSQTVTLIPGDGIGPAITDATVRVLEAAGAPIEWDRQSAGSASMEKGGDPLPQATLDAIERDRVVLKGPLTTPIGAGFRSINVALRKHFDLYANIRPVQTMMPGGRYEDIDLVMVRENTEGLYIGIEHFIGMEDDPKAVAESVMLVTRYGAERIVRYAFDYALRHDREKVTLVHKANILKCTQGLFLEVGRQVAEDYEGRVEFEDKIIDNTAMQLVLNPHQFDVLVTENMFGDILSDEMAGLVGGLGLAPGANIGDDAAMFEPVHGSAPDIAGRGIANPCSCVLAACLLLDHLEERPTAERIRGALRATLEAGESLTPDLGGDGTTESFTDAIIKQLERDAASV